MGVGVYGDYQDNPYQGYVMTLFPCEHQCPTLLFQFVTPLEMILLYCPSLCSFLIIIILWMQVVTLYSFNPFLRECGSCVYLLAWGWAFRFHMVGWQLPTSIGYFGSIHCMDWLCFSLQMFLLDIVYFIDQRQNHIFFILFLCYMDIKCNCNFGHAYKVDDVNNNVIMM